MMKERIAQLQAKLEADGGFADRLFSLETPEEVQDLLKAEGMTFTLEEINALKEVIIKVVQNTQNGGLSDEELEEVAGGNWLDLENKLALWVAQADVAVHKFFRRW